MGKPAIDPPTVAPSTEEYRRMTGELIALWEETGTLVVNRKRTRMALLLHSLVAHSVSNARAARLLIEGGEHAPAIANIRVAWESAVTAWWISEAGEEGIERFLKTTEAQELNMYAAAKKVMPVPPDILEMFESADQVSRAERLPPFSTLCDDFGEDWLYLQYRALSEFVHPSKTMSNIYVQGGEVLEDWAVVTRPGIDMRPYEFTLAWAVVLAVGLYERTRKYRPNRAKVDRLAASVGLPSVLQLPAANRSATT